jgi:H+/Cl- antiporter ClcA
MQRERTLALVATLLLLLGSLFWTYWRDPQSPPEGPDAFRTWFWDRRRLDLIAQVGLIFAGALGVAAILPEFREEETDVCTWL